jgi:hypothetical protein
MKCFLNLPSSLVFFEVEEAEPPEAPSLAFAGTDDGVDLGAEVDGLEDSEMAVA